MESHSITFHPLASGQHWLGLESKRDPNILYLSLLHTEFPSKPLLPKTPTLGPEMRTPGVQAGCSSDATV